MEPIFYSNVTTYRVVVSHNPKNPDVFYIDMCRDGFCSHDLLLKMQKKFYRNKDLERVFNDSKGIFLKEYRDGRITLCYIHHNDVMAQQKQARLRAKVDGEIIRVFKRMREENKLQTISVQTEEFYYDTQRPNIYQPSRSLYEETARAKLKREERIKQLKEIKQAYYAKQKYADCPQIMLAWKQALRQGD